MPEIKLKHIVSCNSEDPACPAENLLRPEINKKWKCLPGEKQATVIIQFDKSSQIRSLDIGNENSAFVEILVGRESDPSADSYQVLVPACSFMSPADGRSWTNTTRVRLFNSTKLTPSVTRQKWDRLKIVCTQPFNTRVYGISFIRLHDAPESPTKLQTPSPAAKPVPSLLQRESPSFIGKFRLKSEEEVGMTASGDAGSMFKQRSLSKEAVKPESTTKTATDSSSSMKAESLKAEPRKRVPISPPSAKATPKEKTRENSDPDRQPKASASSRQEKKPEKEKKLKTLPYKSLLSDVVFTLSGFQNPMRGQIRQAALDMGAKYRPDWSPDSTHLICAFDNTPKMQQVRGKGKIVRKEFILDAQKNQKRKSWRKYAFDKRDRNKDESEDEIIVGEEKTDTKTSSTNEKNTKEESEAGCNGASSSTPAESKQKTEPVVKTRRNSDEIYNMSTDEGSASGADSGADTDDEIARVRRQEEKRGKKDSYGFKRSSSPGSDPPLKKPALDSDGLPILPEFFDELVFFLYGKFGVEERKLINRYATAFGGKLVNYMFFLFLPEFLLEMIRTEMPRPLPDEQAAFKRIRTLPNITCPNCRYGFVSLDEYKIHGISVHSNLGYVCKECVQRSAGKRAPAVPFFSNLQDSEVEEHLEWHKCVSDNPDRYNTKNTREFFYHLAWSFQTPSLKPEDATLALISYRKPVPRADSSLPAKYFEKTTPTPQKQPKRKYTISLPSAIPQPKRPVSVPASETENNSDLTDQVDPISFDLERYKADRPNAKFTPAIVSAANPEDVLIYCVEPGPDEDQELFPCALTIGNGARDKQISQDETDEAE